MFRSKVFEPTLTGIPYLIFIEGLKSAVTKAAYTFALLINNNKSMLTFSTYKLSEHRDAQGAIKAFNELPEEIHTGAWQTYIGREFQRTLLMLVI
jgi:hypothetical protein